MEAGGQGVVATDDAHLVRHTDPRLAERSQHAEHEPLDTREDTAGGPGRASEPRVSV
jgi:hypothetical protein